MCHPSLSYLLLFLSMTNWVKKQQTTVLFEEPELMCLAMVLEKEAMLTLKQFDKKQFICSYKLFSFFLEKEVNTSQI